MIDPLDLEAFSKADFEDLWRRFIPKLAEPTDQLHAEYINDWPRRDRAEFIRHAVHTGIAPEFSFYSVAEAAACGCEDRFVPVQGAATIAMPGSYHKIDVLAERALCGEQLFLPLDGTIASPDPCFPRSLISKRPTDECVPRRPA